MPEVTLYSCPTGGWVMCNRFVMEDAIIASCGPDTKVTHKVGCMLTALVEVNGKSRREWLTPAMIVPGNALAKCIPARTIGRTAKALMTETTDTLVTPSTEVAMR